MLNDPDREEKREEKKGRTVKRGRKGVRTLYS
jgi:hypothetical protein